MPEVTTHAPGTPSWVDMGSPDLEGSKAFYGALFGWEFEDAGEEAGHYNMATLGGKNVAALSPQYEEPSRPPCWMTYVTVTDADKVAAQAKDAGGTVVVAPMDVTDAGRMAVIVDPVGATFSLWQPGNHVGAQVVNEPGTLCWNELTTREVDQAAEFYGTLGWDVRRAPEYNEFQIDGTSVAGLFPMPPDVPAQVPSYWMPYFAVADADASIALVAANGGEKMVGPQTIDVGIFAIFRDPQDAIFGIIQLKD